LVGVAEQRNELAAFIRSPRRRGRATAKALYHAQCLCRFEVYHLELLWAAADHRATEFV